MKSYIFFKKIIIFLKTQNLSIIICPSLNKIKFRLEPNTSAVFFVKKIIVQNSITF